MSAAAGEPDSGSPAYLQGVRTDGRWRAIVKELRQGRRWAVHYPQPPQAAQDVTVGFPQQAS